MRIFTQYTTERGTDILQDFEYTFDPQGNITTMKDEATQTLYYNNNIIDADRGYTYDALYRLTNSTGREHINQPGTEYNDFPSGINLPHPNDPQAMRRYSRSYEYDDSGNITQMAHTATGGNWTRDYSYTSGKNRLASTVIGANTVNYTHDNNGNIESLPNTGAVTWDSEDRIKEVNLGGGGTAYYTYNAEGQRVRKVIHNNQDIKIKETIYLDGYEVYREFVTGTVDFERETLHIMDDESRVAMVETKTIENSTPISSPVPRIRYQHSDHLGSCSVETTDTGALISFEEYYPYGGTSFQSTSSSSQVSAKRYRYNGKEKDEETDLYYYGARYYISWLGRWMNCDPLYDRYSSLNAEDRAGFDLKELLNLYRYCLNNPVTYIDSKGMNSEEPQKKQPEPAEKQKKEPVSNLVVDADGDETYQAEVLKALKELDPTASIDTKTGEVTVGKKAAKGHEKGHELLKRIISNDKGHKVVITDKYFTRENSFNFADPTDKASAEIQGKGSGSIIGWHKDNETTVPVISKEGKVIMERSIPHISLGHELIHAERAIRGVGKRRLGLVNYEGLDKIRVREPREEAETIGVGGFNKPGDITENDLRKELKLLPRVRHRFSTEIETR